MLALKMVGIALALLVAFAGIGVAVAWTPERSPESLAGRWAQPPSRFITVDGMQIHIRDEGPRDDAQPIVLLHGTSDSLHAWEGWAAALQPAHRVIRADMPGFGLTGPTPDGIYTMPVYTRFVVHLMDQLGVRHAVLAGNSFGGYVAWKTAVDHPDRITKLILVDAGGYADQAQSTPIGFRLAKLAWLKPILSKLLLRRTVESSLHNVYGDASRVTPALVDRFYELTLRDGNREAVIERFRQAPSGEFESQIRQIRQPTLIIWGGRDRLIPPDIAYQFQRDIAGSRVATFDTLGHVPHEEDPVATVQSVQAFL